MGNEAQLDYYTKETLEHGISRRSFLTRTASAAAGVGLLGMAGCAPRGAHEGSAVDSLGLGKSSDGAAALSFLPKPEPIPDSSIKTAQIFDVVIVGAGASGVPASLSAAEHGAAVAVLQKENIVVSQGNSGTGIDLAKSDPAGIEALVARLMKDNAHRCNPKLIRQWAYNSGEAVTWVIERAKRGGAQVIDQGNLQQGAILKVNGYELNYITSFFGPKPYTAGDGMRALAKTAAKAGARFFFSTPAVQLIQDASGHVTGVIGKREDGTFMRFIARKGVILATGDYQNNQAMCDYFIPDAKHFGRKQVNRTGDGFIMGYWAGGVIEPIGHTKMLHDFDAGPASMCDMPFLAVDQTGKRFVNETVEMSVLNNYLRQAENTGQYSQIFDSNYMTQAANWPGKLVPPDGLKNYMPDEPGPHHGVFETFINTHKADTLEELAQKIKVDTATFVATVKRYNEVVASGRDSDFGKPADLLHPIDTPPFYAYPLRPGITFTFLGLKVDERARVLMQDGKPSANIFASGEIMSGNILGQGYLAGFGMTLGTVFGRIAGEEAARHVRN